jgi:hypothetical protein
MMRLASVADGVDGDLKAGFIGAQNHFEHVAFRKHHGVWQA